jgi:hypothetical protein
MVLTWVNALLAVISLGTGVVFVQAAARRPAGRFCFLAHALMGLGMAGMFSPWGDPVRPGAGALVFVVIAAWFGAQLLRTGRVGPTGSIHLVVGPAAMVLMYLTMGSMGSGDMAGMTMADPAHAGHSMTMGGGGGSPLLSAVSLGLVGYFAWYAWLLSASLRRPVAPTSNDATVAVAAPAVVTTRVVVGAHVAMCVLMAVMFLGAI